MRDLREGGGRTASRRTATRAGVGAMALTLALATACGGTTRHRTISAASVSGRPGFAPDSITVDKGDKLSLRVGNNLDKPHGFSIEGYPKVKKVVEPGKPITVKFTASRSGTFRIFCQLHPTHQGANLVVR